MIILVKKILMIVLLSLLVLMINLYYAGMEDAYQIEESANLLQFVIMMHQ
jgi:hypothetical protein